MLIDDCEHVSAAAADAVAQLPEAWTDVQVLATSRSPRGLEHESIRAAVLQELTS